MPVWLRLKSSTGQSLLDHMHAGAEHVAFMNGQYQASTGCFELDDLFIVRADGLEYGETDVTLRDDNRQAVLEWATGRGEGILVEAHSHGPLGDPVAFSLLDLQGLHTWVPHVRWRLGGRPYAALVFGVKTVDGLAWVGSQPERVSRLEVAGRDMYKATGRSFARISHESVTEVDQERYARNVGLLGLVGQRLIADSVVGIVGLGGLGSHVAQQLAYLGVRRFVLVDDDRVELSNLNRLIGATLDDVGELKVQVAERVIKDIQPESEIRTVTRRIADPLEFGHLARVDVLFGCVDNDAARLILTKLTSRHQVPYIDLASDTGKTGEVVWFGGRVFVAVDGDQCLSCAGELDQRALALASMDQSQEEADKRIYGIEQSVLGGSGPMVVSTNGVVASLGVTEFLAMVTQLRSPKPHLVYRGDRGVVTVRTDERTGSCYYCDTLWRRGSPQSPSHQSRHR